MNKKIHTEAEKKDQNNENLVKKKQNDIKKRKQIMKDWYKKFDNNNENTESAQ